MLSVVRIRTEKRPRELGIPPVIIQLYHARVRSAFPVLIAMVPGVEKVDRVSSGPCGTGVDALVIHIAIRLYAHADIVPVDQIS